MIKKLTWDSAFFKRKIGELIPVSEEPLYIRKVLRKAGDDGFEYITCKIKSQNTPFIRLLESQGFYLTDIGLILAIDIGKFMSGHSLGNQEGIKTFGRSSFPLPFGKGGILQEKVAVRAATLKDVRKLKKLVRSLFFESRFYSDPFFSKKEADRLYEAWIENSVRGLAADIVFYIAEAGFITCKRSPKKKGEIVLVGIKAGLRGKGLGSALVGEAMQWFAGQEVTAVTVRTQLRNLRALNFYIGLGFLPKEYDIVFGKIL